MFKGEGLCQSEGFFRDPKDCVQFYRCTRDEGADFFRLYRFACGPGTVFDPTISTCNHPYAAPPCDGQSLAGSSGEAQPQQPQSEYPQQQPGQSQYPQQQPGQSQYPQQQPGQSQYPQQQPDQSQYPQGQPQSQYPQSDQSQYPQQQPQSSNDYPPAVIAPAPILAPQAGVEYADDGQQPSDGWGDDTGSPQQPQSSGSSGSPQSQPQQAFEQQANEGPDSFDSEPAPQQSQPQQQSPEPVEQQSGEPVPDEPAAQSDAQAPEQQKPDEQSSDDAVPEEQKPDEQAPSEDSAGEPTPDEQKSEEPSPDAQKSEGEKDETEQVMEQELTNVDGDEIKPEDEDCNCKPLSSIFQCKSEGRFPDRTNCQNYYRCTSDNGGFTADMFECDMGFAFDADTSKCVPEAESKCQKGSK